MLRLTVLDALLDRTLATTAAHANFEGVHKSVRVHRLGFRCGKSVTSAGGNGDKHPFNMSIVVHSLSTTAGDTYRQL